MAENVGAQRRRTQKERKQEAENALFEAAAQLIGEKGVEHAYLADIGQHAGYSRGLVNHHFGSKEVLIERLSRRMLANFVRSLHIPDDLTGLEGILQVTDSVIQRSQLGKASRAMLVIWTSGLTMPNIHPIAAHYDEIVRKEIIRRVKLGQKDGSIRKDVVASAFAVTLHGLIRGVTLQIALQPEIARIRSLRKQILSMVQLSLEN